MNNNTALLLVDVQQAFDNPSWGQRNNPDAEQNIAALLTHWRQQQWPVIHIRHCSTEPNSTLRPDQPGNAFKPEAEPLANEVQFSKAVNSSFIGTALEQHLHDNDINNLVIVGFTTDHCVSTTTRMAANLGFSATLVEDATATFERTGHNGTHYTAEEMHRINLASLSGEFCQVITTNALLDQFS